MRKLRGSTTDVVQGCLAEKSQRSHVRGFENQFPNIDLQALGSCYKGTRKKDNHFMKTAIGTWTLQVL